MADLPSGTVTFLFTDIEGSTERWVQEPPAMRAVAAGWVTQSAEATGAPTGRGTSSSSTTKICN